MDSVTIREVWDSNFSDELIAFDVALERYPVITIDTEFPGFLVNSARNSPEMVRYSDLKYNVENLKLIQLGITLSDHCGNIGGCWEFNFRDFDQHNDLRNVSAIEFLKNNGLDFEKIRKRGIALGCFDWKFAEVLNTHKNIKWVTFHGLYDFAYLYRQLSNEPLPKFPDQFTQRIADTFGCVFDVKFIAGCCHGFAGVELGLEKLAKILELKRLGGAHHAGSDSLLTARIFAKMKAMFLIQENTCQGFLYGLSSRAVRIHPSQRLLILRPAVGILPPTVICSPCPHPLFPCPPPVIVRRTPMPWNAHSQ